MDQFSSFLETLLNDDNYRDEVSGEINEISEKLRNGWEDRKILSSIRGTFSVNKFKIELAKGRISASRRYSHPEDMWLDSFSSRYSTPEIVGKYRSQRLRGNTIVDIGSGAGMQSIFFGMVSETTGIEEFQRRYLLALLNLKYHKDSSAKFLNCSFPECIEELQIDRNTIIFSDPLRGEGRKSDMSNLIPSPVKIHDKFSETAKGVVFDLPVLMDPASIRYPGELEYISVDGILSRLTFYSGKLSRAQRSAVMFPEGTVVSGNPKKLDLKMGILPFLCIPDPAIVKSDLVHTFLDDYRATIVENDNRRLILASNEPLSKVPGEQFEVVFECSEDDLPDTVKKANPSRVYPRFSLPADKYYPMVDRLIGDSENGEPVYLMKYRNSYLISRKLFPEDRLSKHSN